MWLSCMVADYIAGEMVVMRGLYLVIESMYVVERQRESMYVIRS